MAEPKFIYTHEERETLIRAMEENCKRLKVVCWKQRFMVLLGPALAILTIALVRWFDPNRNVKNLANALMAFNCSWISFWVPNAKAASVGITVARDSITRFKSEVGPDGGTTDYDYKREFVDPSSFCVNAGFRPYIIWLKRSGR